jgi:prolipoprotein diacylglyceryl transferase
VLASRGCQPPHRQAPPDELTSSDAPRAARTPSGALHHRAVPTVFPILASIPSPSDNAIKIGGLELRAYGLSIALGVIAAVWIARRRWAARGGDPDDISRLALWAVLAGLIGARLYHVLTDLDRFEGRWLHVFAVWEGGLGIPGGLIAGVGTGAYIAHRRGLPVAQLLDVVAPALPVAQAIGRLGNWFNQELFGRPTDLPWGLEIDPAHRPAGYLDVATFHPTFLYEALWNLALAGGLVLWERRHPGGRPGRLFAAYVAGYAAGRAWVEALRIDPAAHLLGVRWNIWMSAIAFFAAVGWLVFDSWRARRKAEEVGVSAAATDQVVADTTTADTAADTAEAEQPTAAEAEQSTAAEPAEAAEQPDADAPADEDAPPDEEPTPAETADATAEAAEPADAAEPDDQPNTAKPADEDEPPDEEPTSSETAKTPADAADEPATPASNDPEPDKATDDHPVAADPESDGTTTADPESDGAATADPETGQHTDPGPGTDARAATADEEAAT